MLKTHLILSTLVMLLSCNNKMAIDLAKSNQIIPPPPPYQLLGIHSANYGVGGVVQFDNPFDATKSSITKHSVDKSDGSRYHVGFSSNGSNAPKSMILKVDSETGVLDTSFATGGYFNITAGTALASEHDNPWGDSSIINDRYLLITGYQDVPGGRRGYVKLFDTETEAMVASFGTGGTVLISSTDGSRPDTFPSRSMYDQQQNAIVVSYYEYGPGSLQRAFLKVIDLSGNDLASFNGGSPLMISHPSIIAQTGSSTSLIVTPTNYYAVGAQFDVPSTYTQSYIAKYDKTGLLVNSFGTNGVKFFTPSTDATNVSILNSLVDGGGNFFYSSVRSKSGNQFGVIKISKSTGDIDLGFGTAGLLDFRLLVTTSFGPFASFAINDLDMTADGKIIISWADEGFPMVTQIDTNANLDTSFGTNGSFTFVTPPGTVSAQVWAMNRNLDGTWSFLGGCNTPLRRYCSWKIE